jgi:hypothetical protein
MSNTNFKPYWPENMIFWGAGAVADLNLATTDKQAKIPRVLGRDEKSLSERVKEVFEENRHQEKIIDFLVVLGDGLKSEFSSYLDEELEAGRRLYPELSGVELERLITTLRQSLDWGALRRIIAITPKCENPGDSLRELYNILDMHIIAGQGLYSSLEKDSPHAEPYFIPHLRLKPARDCLIMLTNLMFFLSHQRLLEENKEKIEPYEKFFMGLAKSMQKEGIERDEGPQSWVDRKFYMFSYGMISMNFEPMLYLFMFCSHFMVNNNNPPQIGVPVRPLKLFNDFTIFMGVRKIDSDSDRVWYPSNETVVQRLNDSDYNCGRVVRIGKFYFPHGCASWRECQSCGKLTVHLGDKFDFYSTTVFPNPPIPELGKAIARNKREEELANTRPDAITCGYCGTMTFANHTTMVMQSAYKGYHPPYIEEIQRDLKVCLESSKHIVLMGYSLPQDDVVWRSILAARKNRNPKEQVKCSIVVGYNGPDKWLKGDELEEYIKDSTQPGVSTIKSAKEIFEFKNIRAYTKGIPAVWMRHADVQKSIKELFNWGS